MFLIPFGMFVYMLFYVVLPFNEEASEFRKLQNMSSFWYWMTNYVIDLMIHTIFCGVIYVVLIVSDTHNIFDHVDYSEDSIFSIKRIKVDNFPIISVTLTTLLLFYGIAYIPLLYVFGQLFTSMSSLFSFLAYFFLIFSELTK